MFCSCCSVPAALPLFASSCHATSPQALLFPHRLKRVPATMRQSRRTDGLLVCVSIGREIRPIDTQQAVQEAFTRHTVCAPLPCLLRRVVCPRGAAVAGRRRCSRSGLRRVVLPPALFLVRP